MQQQHSSLRCLVVKCEPQNSNELFFDLVGGWKSWRWTRIFLFETLLRVTKSIRWMYLDWIPVHYSLFAGQLKLLELWLLQFEVFPCLSCLSLRGCRLTDQGAAPLLRAVCHRGFRRPNHLALSKVHVDSSFVHVVIYYWMTIFYIPEFLHIIYYIHMISMYIVCYTHTHYLYYVAAKRTEVSWRWLTSGLILVATRWAMELFKS